MGCPIRAIQIDGGSEFEALFEAACQTLRTPLYVLPPRSPTLKAHAERAARTHQEEFYDQLEEIPESIPVYNALFRVWEEICNTVRPHEALGNLTQNSVPRAIRIPMKGGILSFLLDQDTLAENLLAIEE